jgi:hypothetical protein
MVRYRQRIEVLVKMMISGVSLGGGVNGAPGGVSSAPGGVNSAPRGVNGAASRGLNGIKPGGQGSGSRGSSSGLSSGGDREQSKVLQSL